MSELSVDYDAVLERYTIDENGHRTWRELVYACPTGYRPLTLDLIVPNTAGPHPLVIWLHGGAWMAGHPRFTNPVLVGLQIEQTLLNSGFAVSKIAYRLSAECRFPGQLYDAKAAVRYLRQNSGVLGINPDRIAAMGESAGGHLACMLGMTSGLSEMEGDVGVLGPSSDVQAVVDWYGPTDLLSMDSQRPPHAVFRHDDATSPESLLIGGPIQQHKDLAKSASPTSFIRAGLPPFLIQHGDQDRLVPVG